MEITVKPTSILKTKYTDLCFYEDHEQKCLHIWAEFDLDPIIEVEGNHIRIRKGGVSMNEKEKATGT